MKYSIDNLNGLTVIAVQKTTPAKTFNVGLNFKVGAGYEPEKIAGISHFLEHSVFLGTKKCPSREMVEKQLLSFGGDYNAFTGLNHTTYCLSGQINDLTKAVETLYDLGLNPKLSDKEALKKEKKVVLAELEQELTEEGKLSDQSQVAYEELFAGTVLSQSILGTKKSLKGINSEELKAYHRENYHPSKACLTVVTPLNPKDVVKKVAEAQLPTFKKKATGRNEPFLVTGARPAIRKVKCIKTASFTWELDFFYHFERPADPKYTVAFKLLTKVLFHSEMSYIFGAARKAGLVYMAQGGYMHNLGSDVFRVSTNLAGDKAGKFGRLFMKQLEGLLKNGIDQDFLRLCKAHYEFSRHNALEAYDHYAFKLTEKHFLGSERSLMPEEELALVKKVKDEDILDMLRLCFFSDRKIITVKGPDASPEMEDQMNKEQAFY